MSPSLLSTKLYVPPSRAKGVSRARLIQRLKEGLQRKLTLISAPAGFGKTTLVSDWIASCGQRVAWVSLDEGDNDPASFLAYLVAALQTIVPNVGDRALAELQSPQPPSSESILTSLVNEITTLPDHFILVLDDYHVVDAKAVDQALTYLLEHLPPQMHLVLATREDPHLPLARLRAQGQLTELRAADLRFTAPEAAEFLNQVMGLNLTAESIAALESRTEGWIAGLQLAALSLQGQPDVGRFIKSFSGSHHFVLDYLVEEVLQKQPESIQAFLLRTSILDRMCGPLCDAVLLASPASSQSTLETVEHANLFIVPLDSERHWYRYHHLFAELLRQRLQQIDSAAVYHIRASQWYEDNGLEIEAFQHAVAANDIERAERLIDGKGLQLHFRGVAAILDWLKSLPTPLLDGRPSLWVRYASAMLVGGQTTGVEQKLEAAEAALGAALQDANPDAGTRDLIGRIADVRSTLARTRHREETILVQSRRALEPPDDLLSISRQRAKWTMAMADHFQGEGSAAGRADPTASSIAQAPGNIIHTSLATTALGQIQESENQLHLAAESYQRVLQLIGEHSPPNAAEAYLGLARICYEWNDLGAAERHGQQSLRLAQQSDQVTDRFVTSEVFLARLKLAQGDVPGAAAILGQANESVLQNNFVHRMLEVAGVQILVLIRQGDLAAAADLAQTHPLPLSRARVLTAQGNPSAALAILEPLLAKVEARNWQDERLKVMILEAMAYHAQGRGDEALQVLGDTLALAEPGGFIRLFIDEGTPMAELLTGAAAHGIMPDYAGRLLAAFPPEARPGEGIPDTSNEILTQRELEVLQLIAQGLSNQEICEKLFLALDTVKGHNRRIYGKLQVQNRTEAAARARELGLL